MWSSATITISVPSAERYGRPSAHGIRATTFPPGSTPMSSAVPSWADVPSQATCAAALVRVTGCGIGWGRTTFGDAVGLPDADAPGAATPALGGACCPRKVDTSRPA